jgi:SAM-dependent methyltransferase
MEKFNTKKEYEEWAGQQDWYQTIHLPSGLKTVGKVPTDLRLPIFERQDFKGKSFLDIGCNSGQYCFLSKGRGASEVLGVDIDAERIGQARILAQNEELDVHFEEKGIFDLQPIRKFDIVFCLAVLTEIQDFFGAVEELKKVIGERAYIELDLAKPIVYFSASKKWLRGETTPVEVREIRGNKWTVSPSLKLLKKIFGEEFRIKKLKGGIRYDLIEVERIHA